MAQSLSKASKQKRLAPTLVQVAIVLMASWMKDSEGGYGVREWAPIAFILAALALIGSVAGVFRSMRSRWSTIALCLFAAYATWRCASLL